MSDAQAAVTRAERAVLDAVRAGLEPDRDALLKADAELARVREGR